MDLYKPCSTMTIELINYIQEHPETVHHMDQFLMRYQNAIFNFVHMTVRNYHDSLDITNKVLWTLSKKVKEIREKKAFNHLVLLVIRGEVANYWKGQKTKKAQLLKNSIWHDGEKISLFETLQSDDGKADEILNLLLIRDLIENSDDPMLKQIFYLRYREDQSIEKISQQLDLTEYQTKKYLQDIHNQVKKYLEE